MEMDTVYDRLETIIRRIKGEDISFSQELFDKNLMGETLRLDDIEFVYLILETQNEFGITFSEEELTGERFTTLRAIADAVREKTNT